MPPVFVFNMRLQLEMQKCISVAKRFRISSIIIVKALVDTLIHLTCWFCLSVKVQRKSRRIIVWSCVHDTRQSYMIICIGYNLGILNMTV